jgi:chromosome segregation protein
MRLRRLELFGFKSFADRTALSFEGTLTGIVGPNGCGKSNVVDAIRWVLGETRPTSMRGGEMSDVIFKGSVSRPAMSVAEVTIVLDNSSGSLASHGSEVAITRRVFSSGEGEYLIDGQKVRLRDVRDLLYDTGLGSRGYAVLEQGRIDAVLSQNALDRRAIFEEAAGISRYRHRRRETEARLERVSADLARVDDVLRELTTRVRSLKIQAGKAERYVAARDEWRRERARLLRHRLHAHRTDLARLALVLGELEGRSEHLRRLRSDEETDVAAREREQGALAAEVDRLAAEVARLAGEVRARDERHAQLLARVAASRKVCAEESQRALELASALELREAELERVRGEEAATLEALNAHRSDLDERAVAVSAARESLGALREACERQNERVLAELSARTTAENSRAHLAARKPTLVERGERLSARLEALEGELASAEAERAAAVERLAAAERALADRERERAESSASLREVETALSERRSASAARELDRARTKARIDTLRDLERERESLDAGARALLDAVDRGDGPCAGEALRGLVADHITTSTRLARALDAALGASALALVVESPEIAARLVAWLASNRAGQVRVCVPSALGASAVESNAPAPRLLDEVRCEADLAPLAEALIGDVLVVDDVARALELVRAHPAFRFATPGGDLVDAAGVTGGHRELAQGAVGRRATAFELEAELAELDRRLADDAAGIARAEAERERFVARLGALDAEIGRTRAAASEARVAHEGAAARRSEIERARALAEHESRAGAAELAALEREFESALLCAESAGAQYDAQARELERIGAQVAEAERELEARQRAESAGRVEVARLQSAAAGFRQRVSDIERACSEARAELERARRIAREHDEAAAQGALDAARVRTEGDQLLAERGAAEARHEELRQAERSGREALHTFRQRVDAVTRELEGLSDSLSCERLEAQRLELACQELAARAREDLGLTEAELLDGFEPEAFLSLEGELDRLDAQVAELRAKLDQIGPVNTEAVAELSEASGRQEFLAAQRDDLERSRKSLADAIAHLDEESSRRFLETFAAVREHFQQLFRQLFGGGKADLSLGEGLDPLEAGVEISARPPGREMLPIGLLSGGQRTMTALALLFAVFRARPSPFCVLDEVDAALDDANVGRFLAMVDGFRRDTQFVVVTHNKGTMAACQGLYGITMETKGVSTHVSVEFSEVERFVPEATGDAGEAGRARDAAAREPEELEGEAGGDGGAGEGERERVVTIQPGARAEVVGETVPGDAG